MSVAIKTDELRDWHVSESVEGENHDHCPSCETDREAVERFGGEHGTPLMWEQYSCDRRVGGCGAAWTRTTGYGQARNTERGQRTKWLSTGAAQGRVYSTPSEAYRANYEKVFGHE